MRSIASRLYPRARENRLPSSHPGVVKARLAFLKAAGINFILLQLLFLGLFSYIFGSLFQQTNHTHNMSVLFVDYDAGGAIGDAVRAAYASLRAPSFPTLVERPPSQYPATADLREAVCQTDFWAAVYVTPGASDRLSAALAGGTAAAGYNVSDVMAYFWNEALYPQVVDASISANILLLSNTAKIDYSRGNGTGNITSVSTPSALTILAQPWKLVSLDIQPTPQGSRAIYNSVAIILVLIQEFFYLGIINGLSTQFKLYSRIDPYRIALVRNLNSLAYTFVGSLCVTGAIWAFRSGWNVNANQFVLSWISLWLFAHVNFVVLDVFTIWLPPPFVPMALVAWISPNITSVLLPFPLSPAFYRVGYALPAHALYQLLTDIWSGGCNPQLDWALPVLFAWEILGLLLSGLGVFRRCHFATIAEERQAKEFDERLDAAVGLEIVKMQEMRKQSRIEREAEVEEQKLLHPEGGEGPETPSRPTTRAEQEEEEEETQALKAQLANVISRVNTRQRREQEQADVSYGPAFDLAFSHPGDDESE